MTRIYAVSAIVNLPVDEEQNYSATVQVPTFYLFADVQGIVDEDHARRIAERMLRAVNPAAEVHVCVTETSMHAHK
jgi:hypothetical protein